jgi:hypothetical protein
LASHAKVHQIEATATELTANLDKFQSVAELYDFLSGPLLLLAQNKISPRADVLAYLTNQLLRNSTNMQNEADAALKKQPAWIIIDVGRPAIPFATINRTPRTGSDSPSPQPVRKTVWRFARCAARPEGMARAAQRRD